MHFDLTAPEILPRLAINGHLLQSHKLRAELKAEKKKKKKKKDKKKKRKREGSDDEEVVTSTGARRPQ